MLSCGVGLWCGSCGVGLWYWAVMFGLWRRGCGVELLCRTVVLGDGVWAWSWMWCWTVVLLGCGVEVMGMDAVTAELDVVLDCCVLAVVLNGSVRVYFCLLCWNALLNCGVICGVGCSLGI